MAYVISDDCIACGTCIDECPVESPDQLTSSSFWRNQSDAEAGLAAALACCAFTFLLGGGPIEMQN